MELDIELSTVRFTTAVKTSTGPSSTAQPTWDDDKRLRLYADTNTQVVVIRDGNGPWVLVPYANVASMVVRGPANEEKRAAKAEELPAKAEVAAEKKSAPKKGLFSK